MSKIAPNNLAAERLKLIGKIIRKARENLRYSYRELAELSGVSASQLLRIESGEFEFSVTKFMQVAEALGLSVGMILDTAMFRSGARMKSYSSKALRTFVAKKGLSAEESENQLLMVSGFVDGLAEVAATLILSSNPEAMCFYFDHPFPALVEALQSFAHTRVAFGPSHHERVAALKALSEDPVGKLTQWGVLNEALMDKFLLWGVPRLEFCTNRKIHCCYANLLVGPVTSQIDDKAWTEKPGPEERSYLGQPDKESTGAMLKSPPPARPNKRHKLPKK